MAVERDVSYYPITAFSKQLIVLLRNFMVLLEQLHQHGIVHGDIDFNNIAFKRKKENLGPLRDVSNEELV